MLGIQKNLISSQMVWFLYAIWNWDSPTIMAAVLNSRFSNGRDYSYNSTIWKPNHYNTRQQFVRISNVFCRMLGIRISTVTVDLVSKKFVLFPSHYLFWHNVMTIKRITDAGICFVFCTWGLNSAMKTATTHLELSWFLSFTEEKGAS